MIEARARQQAEEAMLPRSEIYQPCAVRLSNFLRAPFFIATDRQNFSFPKKRQNPLLKAVARQHQIGALDASLTRA
jgi:hypothetical protein